jgi:hypothetical protein
VGTLTQYNFFDSDLVFDPVEHAYTHRGRRLTSVTRIIEAFSHPFDAQFHAGRIAYREGRSVDSVLQDWEQKGLAAAELGTELHQESERIARQVNSCGAWTHPEAPPRTKAGGYYPGIWEFYEAHTELSFGWAVPEVRICHPDWDWGVAGTVDLICSLRGAPAICDWKTSGKLDLAGYKRMKPPLRKIHDSNFWHYALQLNLYRRILAERYDYEAELMEIIWLKPCGACEEVEVPKMDWAVNKLLDAAQSS